MMEPGVTLNSTGLYNLSSGDILLVDSVQKPILVARNYLEVHGIRKSYNRELCS